MPAGMKTLVRPDRRPRCFGGHEFLDEGHRGDVQAAHAEPDAGAQDRQQNPAVDRGDGRGGGEDDEDDDAPDEGVLASPHVGHPPPGDGAQDRAQTRSGQDDAGVEAGEAPSRGLDQHVDDEADEEHVEELRHVAHDGHSDEGLLVAGEAVVVDLFGSGAPQRRSIVLSICVGAHE